MLHAVILVCAMNAACTADTAIDVMRTPVQSAMPVACFVEAQAFVAQMQIGRDLREGETVRIVCERSRS